MISLNSASFIVQTCVVPELQQLPSFLNGECYHPLHRAGLLRSLDATDVKQSW